MSDTAIRVDGLGKQYRIGEAVSYKTLREALLKVVTAPLHWITGNGDGPGHETIWALRDVSFEVKQGEVLGIIGPNGAGKSTLLKVLSRITEPTEGQAEIYGRVGSLLEVGTGFHPELTGRENIFLNGAILGMKRSEINQVFDQIVAFSEIEKFVDTPVKRYSSGMYTRLAFAVAAHLDPEILMVDEVLAVGDTEFQKKCLGKMGDIATGGRTVLFVSHNMGTITDLCEKVVLLQHGRLAEIGPTEDVIATYIRQGSKGGHLNLLELDPDRAKWPAHLIYAETRRDPDGVGTTFAHGEDVVVRLGVQAPSSDEIILGVVIRNMFSHRVLSFTNRDEKIRLTMPPGGRAAFDLKFTNILNHGDYSLSLRLWDARMRDLDAAKECMVITSDTANLGQIVTHGAVYQHADWRPAKDAAALDPQTTYSEP